MRVQELLHGRISAARGLTSRQLVQASLDKIKATLGLNAYISVCGNQAIKAADESDERRECKLSPLDGIPIAVKDNISTRNILTTCASHMLSNYNPPYDATVVARLKNCGAIIIGKTNMDEFAMGSGSSDSFFGPVINPWKSGLFKLKQVNKHKQHKQEAKDTAGAKYQAHDEDEDKDDAVFKKQDSSFKKDEDEDVKSRVTTSINNQTGHQEVNCVTGSNGRTRNFSSLI